MSQDNNTSKSIKYKHLTESDRFKIEILTKEGLKAREIDIRMKKGTRTIEREISKGLIIGINSDLTDRGAYCVDAGERIYEENGKNKG